jgi:hypothetical protein
MQGLVSVTMDNKLTLCLEAEVRQGWKGGKDQGVRTSKIQFIVVRKECDISVDHLYKWALREMER